MPCTGRPLAVLVGPQQDEKGLRGQKSGLVRTSSPGTDQACPLDYPQPVDR
jgi:hypothetical protein